MAQNILSNISSLVFRFHRRQPLAIVKNEDTNTRFTPAQINSLGNLNLQRLQNITTGVFELGRPNPPAQAGVGGVCPEVGLYKQLSVRNNCLDCVKKNFLECVFNRGSNARNGIYRALLRAGNPTAVTVQDNRPGRNDIFIDCPDWHQIAELLNISQQVVATDNDPTNPWRVECHFHVFLPDRTGNIEVGQSNKVELTLRFRRDGAKIQKRKMAERRKIKSDVGESKEKNDTASGAAKGRGRFDFINDDKTYRPRAERQQKQGNRGRWGGKKTRKNKSRQSMKKKSRKSRKSMKKKSRKSRKSMKKKI